MTGRWVWRVFLAVVIASWLAGVGLCLAPIWQGTR